MPAHASVPDQPAWSVGASRLVAALEGLKTIYTTPCMVLFAGALGFGALARDMGFTSGQAAYLSVVLYALPAQVVLIDQLGRGAPLLGAAFAVSLTAIRMLPMVVVLMPLLRSRRNPGWSYVVAVHLVAVTAWIEGLRRLPHLPDHLRLPHFMGVAIACMLATVVGAFAGYYVAGSVPLWLSAAFLFMTPVYFILSMISTARTRPEYLAIALGVGLGPVLYIATPGFDLLLAGLIGGTISFLVERRARWQS
jgi:predicted branched-subunit amino acid permease